jgi:hypothetical protein
MRQKGICFTDTDSSSSEQSSLLYAVRRRSVFKFRTRSKFELGLLFFKERREGGGGNKDQQGEGTGAVLIHPPPISLTTGMSFRFRH